MSNEPLVLLTNPGYRGEATPGGFDDTVLGVLGLIFGRSLLDPSRAGQLQRFSEVLEIATAELLADGNARGWAYLAGHRLPRRVTDSTAVNNSTVLVNDTVLKCTIAANRSYSFEGVIFYSTTAAADIKFAFTVPSGSSLTWATSFNGGLYTNISGTAISIQRTDAGPHACFVSGTGTIGTTQGDLQLQFAQDTADVSDTKLLVGSRIHIDLY